MRGGVPVIVVDTPMTGDDEEVMMVGDAGPWLVGVWSGASLNPESVDQKNCWLWKKQYNTGIIVS